LLAKLWRDINVQVTSNLLAAVRNMSVTKIVVNSSVLIVGLSDDVSIVLDEAADAQRYRFDLPYAVSRGEAERMVIDAAKQGLSVIVVNPSFTVSPEDFGGRPAKRILKFVKDSSCGLQEQTTIYTVSCC
jgi:dihydroflavonol-4-reductase